MEFIKKYKWLIVIFALYVGIVLIVTYLNPKNNNNLIVSNNAVFHYRNGKWSVVSPSSYYSTLFNNVKMYDTENNSYLGIKSLKYDNGWKIKGENQIIKDKIFGYKGSSKFKLYNYDYQEITSNDINNINNFLSDNNLGDYSGLSLVNKISVDLDNDNREESIYTISNMYMDGKISHYFSIIFIYNNGEYNILDKIDLYEDDLSSKNQATIYKLMDVDNDNKIEIITQRMYFSQPGNCTYYLYSLKNDKYVLQINS